MPSVHLKYALQLEEDGQFAQAEQQYLLADKPKEAVLMWVVTVYTIECFSGCRYIHEQNWDAAERLAESKCPDAIAEVFIGQARVAVEQSDFVKAESYLLRANRPDIILRYYKEVGKWTDVLRIAKEFLPGMLAQLQDESDLQQLKSGAKGALSFVAQGKDWEAQEG